MSNREAGVTVYPLAAVRAVALHAQGLAAAENPTPTPEAIYQAVERVGCVQMDTIHVIQRSHYLTLWSRLGKYDPADFDRLIYAAGERRLFEGWQRCASIIPLKDYRYQMPHQRYLRERPAESSSRWLAEPGSAGLLNQVLERIRQEGAVFAGDFEYSGPKRSGWWDWKPAKNALEHLYAWGDLMIAERVKFQRVYDLTGRVLPQWVDTREPTVEQRDRYWIEQGARALGICQLMQAADYSYRKRSQVKGLLEALRSEGVLVPVQANLADGKAHSMVAHRDCLELLQQAADGSLPARRTTFLNPFDNLFWAQGRDRQLWNFRHTLEAYKPAPQRLWGYFCLSILHGDRLVGRFDPKLERQAGLLRLKSLYLEEGVAPDEELVAAVAGAMRDFMDFHNAKDLLVERSIPQDFGSKLMAAL